MTGEERWIKPRSNWYASLTMLSRKDKPGLGDKCPLSLLQPVSRRLAPHMEYAQDLNVAALDAVWYDERKVVEHKFSCAIHASGASHVGELREHLCAFTDKGVHITGSGGALFCRASYLCVQISQCHPEPFNAHDSPTWNQAPLILRQWRSPRHRLL